MTPTSPMWTPKGIISPINENDPQGDIRSPYDIDLVSFFEFFALTKWRVQILEGFLEYRARLHAQNLTQGFQWLDGSFVENKEMLKKENPGDIDVLTFYHLPSGITQNDLLTGDPLVFSRAKRKECKQQFHVDSLFVNMGVKPEYLVSRTAYWYSLFAHSRDTFAWKGFIKIDLSPQDDAAAKTELARIAKGVIS